MIPTPLHLAMAVAVQATVETAPMPDPGDAADDPAIWLHPTDPGKSLVLGTNKQGGLVVYDLAGSQVQYLDHAPMNNVDVRYGFALGGERVDLVAAGNRDRGSVDFFRVDVPTRRLVPVGSIDPGVKTYGTCLSRRPTGAYDVWVTSKSGIVEQWQLGDDGRGRIAGRRVRTLRLGGITEGCVADDEAGAVYLAEEARGIWKVPAAPDAGDDRTLVDGTESGHLTPDIEGLALVSLAGGRGYLLASSQGSDDFAVYDRKGDNPFLARFSITDGAIDGAEQSDGIEATAADLGAGFPGGLLVVQNGVNAGGGNQTFLLVPWAAVTGAAGLPVAPACDPRSP